MKYNITVYNLSNLKIHCLLTLAYLHCPADTDAEAGVYDSVNNV